MADTEPSITGQPVKLAGASEGNDEESAPPKSPTRRPPSPRKEASGSPEKYGKKKKKESFQWNTPADEFAEDVGSEDEGEYDDGAGEGEEGEGEEGGFSFEITVNRDGKGEMDEDMARFLAEYSGAGMPKVHPRDDKPMYKPKNRYPCPKCPRVWNFPWELRRHVLTHYRQVIEILFSTLYGLYRTSLPSNSGGASSGIHI